MASLACEGEPKGREEGEQYDTRILQGFFYYDE